MEPTVTEEGIQALERGDWVERAEAYSARPAGDVPEQGWLALTRAERSQAPVEMARHAAEALQAGRRLGDPDLEAAALVRAGYAEVATGDVVPGWP